MKVRTLFTTALAGLMMGTLALAGAPQAMARDRGGRDTRGQQSRQYGGNSNWQGGWQNTYDQQRGQGRRNRRFRDKDKQNRGRHRGWYKTNERGCENSRRQDREQDRDR